RPRRRRCPARRGPAPRCRPASPPRRAPGPVAGSGPGSRAPACARSLPPYPHHNSGYRHHRPAQPASAQVTAPAAGGAGRPATGARSSTRSADARPPARCHRRFATDAWPFFMSHRGRGGYRTSVGVDRAGTADTAHAAAVAALRRQYAALPPGAPVRLAKKTSNLCRFRPPARGPKLDAAFDRVLSVDPVTRTAEVEGMVTYEKLVAATLEHGLMPLVVPQLKTITLGGAVVGLGIESSS